MRSSNALRDLEELSLRIRDQNQRSYFREAVQCYFVGANRAAILMTWIVAVESLLGRLSILAQQDGDAQQRYRSIQALRQDNRSYEEDLVNAFGPNALDVFTSQEIEQINHTRNLRNWCAHATPYVPTNEEVRACMSIVVDLVLTAPILQGHRYINHLLDRMNDVAFLPTHGYEAVAANHQSQIRPALHPVLARRLIDKILDATEHPDVKATRIHFLEGMILSNSSYLESIAKELGRLCQSYPDAAARIIARLPDAYRSLDFIDRERLVRHLRSGAHDEAIQRQLSELLAMEFEIHEFTDAVIAQLEPDILELPIVVFNNRQQLRPVAFKRLVADLTYDRTNNFFVNNRAAAFIATVKIEYFDGMSSAEIEELVKAFYIAALLDAHSARNMVLRPTQNFPRE